MFENIKFENVFDKNRSKTITTRQSRLVMKVDDKIGAGRDRLLNISNNINNLTSENQAISRISELRSDVLLTYFELTPIIHDGHRV